MTTIATLDFCLNTEQEGWQETAFSGFVSLKESSPPPPPISEKHQGREGGVIFPGLCWWEVSLWPPLRGARLFSPWTQTRGVGLWHSNQPNRKATGSPPGLQARESGGWQGEGEE